MPRSYTPRTVVHSFGPGPMSRAVRLLIYANAAFFVASVFLPDVTYYLGLMPQAVVHEFRLWQPLTYMFLHAGVFHILFNMLALWMFGVELERLWGTAFFTRFYFVTGAGAAISTMVLALLPFDFADRLYYSVTIGASGAIYGLLLAYGLYFPNRPIYLYFFFPVPAKYFVLILGAITFLLSVNDSGGGVAHVAHLGGMVFGFAYLRLGGARPLSELKYRYFKWKMNRHRRRFDVYSGGRADDWDRRIH
ncbi:MAG: rhomboid family intramembrane serine protease [Vicinamibacterales bacterium]